MAKECLVCGKNIGALTGKVKINDGIICIDCWTAAGFDKSMQSLSSATNYSSNDIKNIIEEKNKKSSLIRNFHPTKQFGNVAFDDNSKYFTIKHSKNNIDLFKYDQIVSFELLEDGDSITKGGLGRAVAGGVLFGGVGAVVGGITGTKKTKKVCESLKIKITLRNSLVPVVYINYILLSTKTDGIIYKTAYRQAQDVMSYLQIVTDMIEQDNNQPIQASVSAADEILKFKQLLDAGIISQEEFEAKKKQLLGL